MKLTPIPLDFFTDNLRESRPFSFARYGDGEWLTILGEYGRKNSNGCTFTPALADDLRLALARNQGYMYSTLTVAHHNLGRRIDGYCQKNKIGIKWYKGDVLLNKLLKGLLWPVVEQMRQKRVLYVGPYHCRQLNEHFFNYIHYIQPPPQNAHQVKDKLITSILRAVQAHKIEVIGYSSGLAAKVFIDEVYRLTSGEVTQIDFGSMWDGFFKIPSRSYIRKGKVKWQTLLEVNTGQRERRDGETFRR